MRSGLSNTNYSLDLTDIGDPADNGATVFNVQSYPFLPNDNSSKYYRFPAMVVANDGSIVVASDKRYSDYNAISGHAMDIVVRRSTDGGQSWSNVTTIAKGTTITTFDSYKKLSVKGLTEQSTSISVTSSSTDWLGIANFTVRLLRVGTIVGDVDRSGTVDSEDLNMLISVLLGTTDAEDYDEIAADANEDGILGIGDVTALVNILLEEQQ